ncbi:hypothetical protein GO986_08545 [Deinococcus sp. HMF7620]|uniref:Uncharacterized protein n=1 Tax=Deinococcus arboris TaxID=2682977 RepID=A0A7C9HXZ6_9DEIO|nr:hypothetical protein [Deinococcus arboris]MVN86810.1 hypothetical protein [Deinococcus arboris]
MSRHGEQKQRSGAYLERLKPHEQAVAEQRLTWNWTEQAKDLLTRYPRRTTIHDRVYPTSEAIEQQLIEQWGRTFPTVVEFQRELCGVTFPTAGPDGDWLTWGLSQGSIDPPRFFEPQEIPGFSCSEFSTARPDYYVITLDGRLTQGIYIAQSAQTEIERLAFQMHRRETMEICQWWSISIEQLPLSIHSVFQAVEAVLPEIGWSVYAPGSDDYHRIYSGGTGYASCRYGFEDQEHLFFRLSAHHPEIAALVYASISKLIDLPPLKFGESFGAHTFHCGFRR